MHVVRRSIILCAASAMLAITAAAQGPATTPAAQPSTARAARAITPADIKAWNAIRQSALSNDGKWFAYVLSPVEGNATVILTGTAAGAKETRYPAGEGGGQISISGDSKWMGFIAAPPRAASNGANARGAEGAAGRGAPGAGGAGGAGSSAAAARNKFVLVNLATGEKKEFEKIRRFVFNGERATWVAMQGYAPSGSAASGGASDLLLYNLASGEMVNIGNVAEFAFDDSGDLLAYTIDATDQHGNGVQLRDMKTAVVRAIDSDRALYRKLVWADSMRALAVLRGTPDSLTRDTLYAVVTFTSLTESGLPKKRVFDPKGRADFPAGMKVAVDRAPRFSEDLTTVFFGIREAKKAPPAGQRTLASAEGRGTSLIQPGAPGAGGTINQPRTPAGGNNEDPSLILWHWKDPRLQSQQIVQENTDRTFSYLAEYRLDDDRFVRLADDSLRTVTLTPGERYAYGTDSRAYEQAASYSGRNYSDVYGVDLRTGARTLLLKKQPSGGGSGLRPSPDGKQLLYWGTDGHYWVLDLATGAKKNITRGVATSFVNTEDDHNNLHPPARPAFGWAKDGSAVLLSDGWDIWKVPVRGGSAVNLTVDGRKNQVRYQRLYSFDATGRRGAAAVGGVRGGFFGVATDGIDLSRPLYIATYGEWTKKEGLSRVEPSRAGATTLLFEPAKFSIQKARDADVYVYTRQTLVDYPNYWVANADWKGGRMITDANPQQKDFAWSSGMRLINYTSAKGDKLQGALYLPANYEPGKKYPLLVTIYEKRSQNANVYVSPTETRAPDPSLYTSRGYAVLDPDIVYRVNDPGMSAVWCVVPAVQAAIATGIVDAKHVGLWGHSWGGYQTAFLVTQTNIFSAAVAGAALTDMVSMYSSIYWNTGGTNQAIFESSQGRFKGNFTENYDAYIRNSPVFHAKNVKTPLLLLHNDKDGAVDFNQGVTYFNTLRQLGKDVIFLEYVGENHGLARPVNQKDYAVRMSEFFDYHLKGAPAPDWITNGVPRLTMEEHLRARRQQTEKLVETAADTTARKPAIVP